MVDFHYETDFRLTNESQFADWLNRIIASEGRSLDQIDFIFCDDEYLFVINRKYLDHDTYTDIISFDYSIGKGLAGDIFISVERIKENATSYNVAVQEELLRVMAHGILHLLGYKDKEKTDVAVMRSKENEKIKMFHVEQI